MKNIFAKRQVVIAALVLALGGAVGLNWYFTNGDGSNKLTPVIGTAGTQAAGQTTKKNLGDAAYVNGTTAKPADQESEYFVSSRLERQTARDASIEQLNKIINNKNASEAAVKDATAAVAKISANINKENQAETLIKAKGYSNCLVMISEESAEVIVKTAEINDTIVLQIKEIVMKQTSFSADKITIIQVK